MSITRRLRLRKLHVPWCQAAVNDEVLAMLAKVRSRGIRHTSNPMPYTSIGFMLHPILSALLLTIAVNRLRLALGEDLPPLINRNLLSALGL